MQIRKFQVVCYSNADWARSPLDKVVNLQHFNVLVVYVVLTHINSFWISWLKERLVKSSGISLVTLKKVKVT